MYNKTQWLDRNDPSFDINTSPEVDADNLNKIENGIYNASKSIEDSLNNLSTAYSVSENNVITDIELTSTDIIWNTVTDSTDENVFTISDVTYTILIKKPGSYNFKTDALYSSSNGIPVTVTTQIVDSVLLSVWHTDTALLYLDSLHTQRVIKNKGIIFESADLPKTLKITHYANATGMRIADFKLTVNTLVAGATFGDHAGLSGLTDANCHPIEAITDLHGTLNGTTLSGEAV